MLFCYVCLSWISMVISGKQWNNSWNACSMARFGEICRWIKWLSSFENLNTNRTKKHDPLKKMYIILELELQTEYLVVKDWGWVFLLMKKICTSVGFIKIGKYKSGNVFAALLNISSCPLCFWLKTLWAFYLIELLCKMFIFYLQAFISSITCNKNLSLLKSLKTLQKVTSELKVILFVVTLFGPFHVGQNIISFKLWSLCDKCNILKNWKTKIE